MRPLIYVAFVTLGALEFLHVVVRFFNGSATLTLTKVGNNSISWTARGEGHCFKGGNHGGPVKLYLKKNGGDPQFIANCNDSPCLVEGAEAIGHEGGGQFP